MKSSITPLPSKGRRLLQKLVDFIGTHKVVYDAPSTFPNYNEMYHAVVPNAPPRVFFVGHNLRKKGLDELNDWTMANHALPKVTGLIVDQTTRRPGKGFFPSYNKIPFQDDLWWHGEVRKTLAFDWSPFVGSQKANSPPILADDLDEDDLAPRTRSAVSRIIRDTKIVREVKALHGHTCQMCSDRLELSPGVFYSEAHHLKPLGMPHHGPDKKSNVLCVCPNCHVKLDFHAIRVDPAALRTAVGHSVGQRFIDHHNKHC